MVKNIRFKIMLAITIFVLGVFFSGFFLAKNVYAKTPFGDLLSEVQRVKQESGKSYYIVFYVPDGDFYRLLLSDVPFKVAYSPTAKCYRIANNHIAYNDYDSDHFLRNEVNDNNDFAVYPDDGDEVAKNGEILLSNHNVINITNNTVFFSPRIVSSQVKSLNLGQVMSQVITLVPIMVCLIVGFVALRKALRVLSAILRRG